MATIAMSVIEWFKGLPGRLVSAAAALGSKLWEWGTAAFNWLVSNLPGIIAAVLSWFRELPGRVVSAAGRSGSKLWEWAKAGFNWLKENLPNAAMAVLNWFRPPRQDRRNDRERRHVLVQQGQGLDWWAARRYRRCVHWSERPRRWCFQLDHEDLEQHGSVNCGSQCRHYWGYRARRETVSMPKLPTYESFHTGGVVPGRRDEERTVRNGSWSRDGVHRDQTRALGIAVRSVGAGAPELGVDLSSISSAAT